MEYARGPAWATSLSSGDAEISSVNEDCETVGGTKQGGRPVRRGLPRKAKRSKPYEIPEGTLRHSLPEPADGVALAIEADRGGPRFGLALRAGKDDGDGVWWVAFISSDNLRGLAGRAAHGDDVGTGTRDRKSTRL